RTVLEYGVLSSLLQLVVFPLEMLYHYAPWSAGLLFLLSRVSWRKIREHPFIAFCGISFLANIWIYWTSPQVYARYLIMFGPLYFGVFVYLYRLPELSVFRRIFDYFLILLAAVGVVGSFVPPFYHESAGIPNVWTISILMFCLLATSLWALIRFSGARLLLFSFLLIVLRFGFDLVVLPLRNTTTSQAEVTKDSNAIGKKYAGAPMYIYGDYEVNHENGFYLTNQRRQILERSHFLVPGSYMLLQARDHPWVILEHPIVDSIRIKETERYFHVVKIPNE
nr:hypothetical protein [Saprospiraceae bacterium]